MSKSLNDNTQSSNSRYWNNGIFTEKCEIVSVEDFSNYPLKKGEVKAFESGFAPELCLRLVVNSGGEDRKLNVFGRFSQQIDKISGKVIKYMGWKAKGNAVQNLIVKLGLGTDCLNEDDSIKQNVLNKMVGMSFYRLRYCIGAGTGEYADKPQFRDWNVFEDGKTENGDEILYREWLKVAQYFNSYDPNYFDSWNEQRRVEDTQFKPEDGPVDDDII